MKKGRVLVAFRLLENETYEIVKRQTLMNIFTTDLDGLPLGTV